jgi:acetylornithine/succinyldiaminopimelate/putrescine aminotransferase
MRCSGIYCGTIQKAEYILPTRLQKVREICDKHNILLILDEIQTGCGRTGTFLASQKSNINYDIVCLGKGLAGGIPVGATLVSKEISLKIPKQIHTSTFGGNPLASAGIVATLELLNE